MGRTSVVAKLYNKLNSQINPATEEKQDDIISSQTDALSNYKASDEDNTATHDYYGYLDKDGNWVIEQINNTTFAHRYAKGTSDYSTNWTNRASLSYDYFNVIF